MTKHSSISTICTIALSVVLTTLATGCATQPTNAEEGISPEPPQPPIEVPDEAARARFVEVHARYARAKRDGSLSAVECEAIADEFNELYEAHPRSLLVARYNVGALREECGDLDEATAIYEELAAKNFHLALNSLGVIAWNEGDSKAALDLFARAVEADPTHAFAARNNLAAAHRDRYASAAEQADFEVAEKQIQNVLAIDTSNKAAYENLARLYYDRGRLDDPSFLVLANLVVTQALRVLDKEGKQSADIWNLEGLLLMQDDNQVDALAAFKKAVEIEPNHADANRNIGFIAIRFRDYATAEKSFGIALAHEAARDDVEVYIAMGVAKRGLNELDAAEEWYRKATEVDAKDPRPWYNLAVLNQDHLVGQPGVETEQVVAYYQVAKQHCSKFKTMAETNKVYAAAVQDCVDRMAIIDDTIETIEEMDAIQTRLEELEALAAAAERKRRQDLLELEKRAMAAGQPSPQDLADEAERRANAARQAELPDEPDGDQE